MANSNILNSSINYNSLVNSLVVSAEENRCMSRYSTQIIHLLWCRKYHNFNFRSFFQSHYKNFYTIRTIFNLLKSNLLFFQIRSHNILYRI